MAHTKGMESFWSMLKRSYIGTFHKFSPKHLNHYVQEFAARNNMRESDTIDMMAAVSAVAGESPAAGAVNRAGIKPSSRHAAVAT